MQKERLLTPSYGCLLAANFLLYFGFYLILPILPFYLTEKFEVGNATIGIVLSCYILAALSIRPFSGYLLDTFSRKPLYILSFALFTTLFAGYIAASTLWLFILFRVIHGFAFGTVTVAGSTVCIDIMPSSRRGEGIGYYGLANNIAMSTGPMVGLFLHEICTFDVLFIAALSSCLLGLLLASIVQVPQKTTTPNTDPISLDRFILLKGIPAGVALLLLSIPYGMTTTYIAMYAREIGLSSGSGLFFTCMAVGMAIARIVSGKQVDKGYITLIISLGMSLVAVCFFLIAGSKILMETFPVLGDKLFFGTALLLGIGFGSLFPAFNTLFINLAPHNKRGTATSTYLSSWDVGIGIGLLAGGFISQVSSFSIAYLIGALLTVISILYFRLVVTPHFQRWKLR